MRIRIILFALILALIGLALAPKASPAQSSASLARVGAPAASDTVPPPPPPDPPPPPPPGDSLPFVTVVRIGPIPCDTCPPVICPDRPMALHLAGLLPNDCNWRFDKLELIMRRAGDALGPPLVRVTVRDNECIDCYSITPLPWSADTILPGLPAGQYWLPVDLTVIRECSNLPDTTRSAFYPFAVQDSCPPPGTSLPYVQRIRIGPPPPCSTCAPLICPAQPIPFQVAGTFPDDCVEFRKLELLPSPIVGPGPEPPIVRIVLAVNDCLGRPCREGPIPWSAETMLPGLPAGGYQLMLQLDLVSMCDSRPIMSVPSRPDEKPCLCAAE